MTPRERSRLVLERSLAGCEEASANLHPRPDPAEAARIQHAVRRLSPTERSVLVAVRFEDRSYAEIGERLGLSVPQVEELFARASSEFLRNLDQPSRPWWRCR
jgi:DNA-directed RNA polymerase specialized sigma24 family protein